MPPNQKPGHNAIHTYVLTQVYTTEEPNDHARYISHTNTQNRRALSPCQIYLIHKYAHVHKIEVLCGHANGCIYHIAAIIKDS